MSDPQLTVIDVDALSYSGTTWLNLVLGSHERAFTLGPPHRVWNLREKGFEGANLVHGKNDTFWRGFNEAWDRKENFLIALGHYAGASHIIFDNPAASFRDEVMRDPRIAVKKLRYFRDGRAISASYWRRNPQQRYADTIAPNGWLYHSFMAFQPLASPDGKGFQYEACQQDPLGFLKQVGAYVGLDYSDNALRFWEWDHHITSGNQGPIAFVKLGKGLAVNGLDFYKSQFEAAQRDPMHGFRDERWREDLTREDLFAFDRMLGAKNAAHGYERDVFTAAERRAFDTGSDTEIAFPQAKHTLRAVLDPLRPAVRKARALFRKVAARVPAASEQASLSPGPAPASKPSVELLDEHHADRLKQIAPYRAIESSIPLATIERNIDLNFYLAYGPDYETAEKGKICVDPMLRYRQLLLDIKRVREVTFATAADLMTMRPEGDEVFVQLRHDVDGDLVAALMEARIEHELGIRSSYYILHTAPYYGQWDAESGTFLRNGASAEVYREIQALGHEIALHTDALFLYQTYGADGAAAIEAELAWLRSEGLNIRGSVAHNSASTYGAVNFAIFKDRQIAFSDKRRMKGVVKDGKWAPLQVLDEAALGLAYEGNDLYWQPDTRVEYFCLMSQNEWFHQIFENGGIRRKSKDDARASWMSQDDVVERIRVAAAPCNVSLSVHPMYYGLRHQGDAPPPQTPLNIEPLPGSGRLGGITFKPSSTFALAGDVGGEPEFQSIIRTNDQGFADVPMSFVAAFDKKILFLGRSNIQGVTVPVASKVSQATARLRQRRAGISTGATSIGAPDATNLQLLAGFQALVQTGAPKFDIAVLSVGADDVILQDPDAFAELRSLDSGAISSLFPVEYADNTIRGALVQKPLPPVQWNEKLLVRAASFFGAETPSGLQDTQDRIVAAVRTLQAAGCQVMLMVEDCGEQARLWTPQADLSARRKLHAAARPRFEAFAAAAGVPLIDPYENFLGTGSFAASHWASRPEWSLHGHAEAAMAIVKLLEMEAQA